MEDLQCSFAVPLSGNGVPVAFYKSHLGRPVCRRRRPPSSTQFPDPQLHGANRCEVSARHSRERSNHGNRKANAKDRERAQVLQEHSQIDGVPSLLPTPAEVSGFDGWREEDNAYWEDLRGREVSFRAASCFTPEDLEAPPQPLDRHGKPATYSAAVHYDHELEQWVPTSEEEEERLRNPSTEVDPFFVAEAKGGEMHTTLAPPATPRPTVEEYDIGRDEGDVFMDFTLPDPPPMDMASHRRKSLNMKPGGWRVVHLGTSSAVPTTKRNVSSTAVIMKPNGAESGGEPSMFLVDAGENTDDRLIRCDWCMTHGFRWIRAIFITHLHGDHIYGLPTLLTNIGRFAQHRRRIALENGDDGSDPVIRIFGPYGTRGFVRTSLYWTNPVGVRFSITELIPRQMDFHHVRGFTERRLASPETFVVERGDTGELDIQAGCDIDVMKESAPPHPEEVRAEDLGVSADGLWHVWEEVEGGVKVEVVAAPLRHRLPCFGYVFRESKQQSVVEAEHGHVAQGNGNHREGTLLNGNGVSDHGINGAVAKFEIDKVKAKELGVHGTQLRVLRSGRAITVSKTGLVVQPEDVAQISAEAEHEQSDVASDVTTTEGTSDTKFRRKVTILGDTCDSSAISDAAMDSDLLVHEATFTQALMGKARVSMHSTARMAGEFGKEINAKKVALTHFSSRFEMLHGAEEDDEEAGSDNGKSKVNDDSFDNPDDTFDRETDEEEDLVSPNLLVREAVQGYGKGRATIIAARDFMEHDVVPAEDQVIQRSKAVAELYALNAETARTI